MNLQKANTTEVMHHKANELRSSNRLSRGFHENDIVDGRVKRFETIRHKRRA